MAAFIVDHQNSPSNLKHFCKICKKGFGCGRALGGHMRAHGIGIGIGIGDDSTGPMDDDDPASDWDDNKPTPTNRRMYALRTNPNRLKTCRVCHSCGKEFLSWKSFLEHGKCTATDDDLDLDDSLPLSSPTCSDDDDDDCGGRRGWSKRKRSLRVKVGSPNSNEEEDLANCLMMLSNGAVDPTYEDEAEAEESCASASKDEHQDRTTTTTTTTTTTSNVIRKPPINFIPPISYRVPAEETNKGHGKGGAGKGMFECKACKKVFNSHQALGGHRASHKKVKGCFAARLMDLDARDRENDDVLEDSLFFPTKSSSGFHYDNGSGGLASTSKMRKTKVHECSICHRIFSSGQALGGHKRCHWITSNAPAPAPAPAPTEAKNSIVHHHFHDHTNSAAAAAAAAPNNVVLPLSLPIPLDLKLDLNLPAPTPAPAPSPSFHAVSTDIYLQSWASCKTENHGHQNRNHNHIMNNPLNNNKNNNNNNNQLDQDQNKGHNNNNSNGANSTTKNSHVEEEEADSKVKLAKLSDLKDMNMSGGNSSPWLQVGIGSTTDIVRPDDP